MRLILIALIFVIAFSCDNTQSNTNELPDSTLFNDSWMKAFSLPYDDKVKIDSNTLLFYYTQSFDTTVALQLKRENDFTRYICYSITPHNKIAARKLRNQDNELTYFDGISGKIEYSAWQSVISEFKKLKFDPKVDNSYFGCCDLPYYYVSFNGETYQNNNSTNQKLLQEFKEYLKVVLINNSINNSNK